MLYMLPESRHTEELSKLRDDKIENRNHLLRRIRFRNPVVVDGIIPVGVRLGLSNIAFDAKHPIIPTNRHHVTSLIMQHIHALEEHTGVAHLATDSFLMALRAFIRPDNASNFESEYNVIKRLTRNMDRQETMKNSVSESERDALWVTETACGQLPDLLETQCKTISRTKGREGIGNLGRIGTFPVPHRPHVTGGFCRAVYHPFEKSSHNMDVTIDLLLYCSFFTRHKSSSTPYHTRPHIPVHTLTRPGEDSLRHCFSIDISRQFDLHLFVLLNFIQFAFHKLNFGRNLFFCFVISMVNLLIAFCVSVYSTNAQTKPSKHWVHSLVV